MFKQIKLPYNSKRLIVLCSALLAWSLTLTYFHNAQSEDTKESLIGDASLKNTINVIDALTLKNLIKRENAVKIINVLSPEAFNDCHIPNSINIPLARLEDGVKEIPFNTHIIVYCASDKCSASRDAFKKLITLGFTNVYAYEGGMKEWKGLGYDSYGSCAMDYLQ